MQTATLDIDQSDAKAQYKAYRSLCLDRFDKEEPELRARLRKEHAEAQRILWHAAQGRKILKLSDSFRAAGLDSRGWPVLAIERADHAYTWCRRRRADTVAFGQLDSWRWERVAAVNVMLPGHKVTERGPGCCLRAVVPAIPPHLKPAGRLERYHILWEAEWEPVAPKDPILLQHIAGDAWAVLAQWDLTEVERMVLAGRFTVSR